MTREILRTMVAVVAVYAVLLACSSGGSSGGLLVPPGSQYPPPLSGGAAGDPGTLAGDESGRPGTPANGPDGTSARDPGSTSLLDTLTDIVPDAEAALNEPGSRLKLRVLAASDGARQFAGFHDTQIDEQCWFTETNEERQHCIPSRVVYLGNYFSDTQCTRRLGTVQGTECVPRFARWSEVVGCHTKVRMFELGTRFPRDSQAYYRNSAGECAEVNVSQDLAWYEAGREVSLDTFVSANVTVQ